MGAHGAGVPALDDVPPVGETWCVGAVVLDAGGRAFVQRRSPGRANFPGCWDVVGGHVEAGETYGEALAREVAEETGWALSRVVHTLGLVRWTGADGVERSEVDYVVEVSGDLARPRLAPGEHDRFAWITPDETSVLDESRAADDGMVRGIVEAAFVAARR